MVALGPVGALNGYVSVPEGSVLHGADAEKADRLVGVHGGWSYSAPVPPWGGEDGFWWLGFDTMHVGDGIDPDLAAAAMGGGVDRALLDERVREMNSVMGGRPWTADDVAGELSRAAERIACLG